MKELIVRFRNMDTDELAPVTMPVGAIIPKQGDYVITPFGNNDDMFVTETITYKVDNIIEIRVRR